MSNQSDEKITKKDLQNLKQELLDNLVNKEEFDQKFTKVVIKDDLKQELANLVTKDEFKHELAKLVTKDDLKHELAKLVTKDELKQQLAKLVTKEEFEQRIATLATRESLEIVANQVARNTIDISDIKKDIKGIKWDIGEMREDIKALDAKFDILMTAINKIAQELSDSRTEKLSINHAFTSP